MRISDWSSDVCSSDLGLTHPATEIHERLPATGVERDIAPPAGPQVGGHLRQRRAVEAAVVDLRPPLVDLYREPDRLGGLAGPSQRAADHSRGADRKSTRLNSSH